ncbi:hypothetical protein Nepgr_029892 [Nepenthes gracilis]|uniref:RING-type E3 ubiquitin transferase n=1 Tax=Nepenthes gracilis TaxID=150966 RepID=A0AAD3Y5J3_NEPGR|nr:hypothetical protein Nepgr_029892 [Nepenthes gracilis]
MKEKEITDAGELLNVAVALNRGSKSKQVMKWAIEQFASEREVAFKLLHVYPKITGVPTPSCDTGPINHQVVGNLLPLSQVRDNLVETYKKEVEWQRNEMLLPYQKMSSIMKVPVEVVLIESDEVANAISTEINKAKIKVLVVGASSNGLFSRKIKALSSAISESAPSFCTVYVVSKGKIDSLRPSDSVTNGNILEDSNECTDSSNSSSRYPSTTLGHILRSRTSPPMDPGSAALDSSLTSANSLPKGQLEDLPNIKHPLHNLRKESTDHNHVISLIMRGKDDAVSYAVAKSGVGSIVNRRFSRKNFAAEIDMSISEQASSSCSPMLASAEGQMSTNLEIEKLKVELRHLRGVLTMAQSERVHADRLISDLSKLRQEEELKLKVIKEEEEKAKELARLEKEKAEAALKEAEDARRCAQREEYQRNEAEMKAARDARDKEKLKTLLTDPIQQYRKFTWEEIESATSSFSEDLKIGMGSYGMVYKCKLHHTAVAVKVLRSREDSQSKQFHQELNILSRIRHPHLLLLLGACPEERCLVYEYMENGSLEERLFCRDNLNKPPIPWFDRYRIAWEVASALAFLHDTKPTPIIHHGLKPSNILLDHNLVSKINGDAGLCTMLHLDPCTTMGMHTLCYIDPEYQRSGLISTKSDVYAFGIVILQLLTAKPPVGIAHIVEAAMDEGRLMQILDREAGKWPARETTELARIGLKCAELRRKDRPDLNKDDVLPALERLKDVAYKAQDLDFVPEFYDLLDKSEGQRAPIHLRILAPFGGNTFWPYDAGIIRFVIFF